MIRGIAILSVTLLLIAWVPWIGPAALILTPLPFIHTFHALGRMKGWLALGIAYALVLGSLLLLGRPLPVTALLTVGLGGVLFAEILQRRYPIERTVLTVSLTFFLAGFGLLAGYALRSGTSPGLALEGYLGAVIGENLKLYGQMNISPEQLQLIEAHRPQITRVLVGIFPSLALAGTMLAAWLNILGGRLLFGKEPGSGFDFGDLSSWKAPEKLVWLLILGGVLVLLVPWEPGATIGMNLAILCSLIYFFQGMAIVSCLFQRRRVPIVLRWLFYVLLALQQYMAILVVAFGLFDIWVDFRRRIGRIDPQT